MSWETEATEGRGAVLMQLRGFRAALCAPHHADTTGGLCQKLETLGPSTNLNMCKQKYLFHGKKRPEVCSCPKKLIECGPSHR